MSESNPELISSFECLLCNYASGFTSSWRCSTSKGMVIRISLLWPYHPWQLRLFPETAPVIFLLSRCHVHLHAPPPLNTHHIGTNDHTVIQLSVFHSQQRNIVFLFVPVLYISCRPLQNQLLPSSFYSLGPLMIWLKPYWSIKSKVWNDHTS